MQTPTAQLPSILKLVAHDVRWAILRELACSDYRVQELVERVGLPQNLVSYHLRKLREGLVVSERRSSADEREVYYRLDLDQFQGQYQAAVSLIHPAFTMGTQQRTTQEGLGARVLFLCTENSARSQMAEALLRHESHGRVEAYSAGSQPAAQIHPFARCVMEQIGIDIRQATPKPLHLFEGQRFDTIITVCDRIREVCPTFPDDPEHIHWSLSDPASVQGSVEEQLHAFERTAQQLTTRIRTFLPQLARKKNSPHEQ
ncbi:ArsR family transcriptional regulator [Ktedonospora formicarum]|uniref:ArsR family transcriptional regulator n=1 Tax=Ktedonospora formicarum TaxID=2778364 RepID=A0A8J3I7G8_9CHLR|nr:ArsR family transcriptional regulator [Ktedonospora formicarum]GHO48871.1 ArsR family transcriptional regulator [Ktedonospora formicarum]